MVVLSVHRDISVEFQAKCPIILYSTENHELLGNVGLSRAKWSGPPPFIGTLDLRVAYLLTFRELAQNILCQKTKLIEAVDQFL